MRSLQEFINKYRGQKVPDPWGTYRGQCVSLVKQWIAFNGWPMRRGNAIMWQYNGTPPYKFFRNYPWTVPQPGDIAIFDTPLVRPDYGHIGIVVSANARTMQIFSQNWPGGNLQDPANVTTFDYVHPKCIGFLRHG